MRRMEVTKVNKKCNQSKIGVKVVSKHCFVYSFYISSLVFPFKRPIQAAGMKSYFLSQGENFNSWLQSLNAMLQSVFVKASSLMLDWCV